MADKVFIIAEAGVNHNGDLGNAIKMIDIAAEAGVDAVKFQTYIPEKVMSKYAPKAEYQKQLTNPDESQLDMARKLRLTEEDHKELLGYCGQKQVMFLSSPFDLESIDLLDRLGLKTFKIPSGEITNLPYLRKVAALKKKVILSTGMADLGEIKAALDLLVQGGTARSEITVLHCNTEYPTPYEDVNLRAMLTMRERLGVKVGYSDHTLGIEVAIAAVALGASVIEKHFTLDKCMSGPDHKASLEPAELRAMVKAIRNIERAMGDGVKKASLSEKRNKSIARKSIIASTDIAKGELFVESNITVKRPGTGINPMQWSSVIGRVAKRDFRDDEVIEL
ncbi:MAG: N-acetylneuraminate synthase [Pseudomonadota bacterium]